MDVLSDVVRVVRLSGTVFLKAELSAPWALKSPSPQLLALVDLPPTECRVLFHILMEGECFVECGAHPPVRMEPGDVIVFPHAEPHMLRSDSNVPVTAIRPVLSRAAPDGLPEVSFGGDGAKARFLYGYLNCDERFSPLVEALPASLLVRARDGYTAVETIDGDGQRPVDVPHVPSTWLGTTLRFIINEARIGRPDNAAMLGRLTELMFVEILREYMDQLEAGRGGWLAGLQDAHVGRALRMVHAHPGRRWTVTGLAREAAISRSAFAQRFTDLIGETPMRYVANWRMHLARQMLREGTSSIQQVAGRVGYESEAAFHRAFKRSTGSPPAAWRREALRASVSTLGCGLMGFLAELTTLASVA
jgi:AraC-like DNA-binding protein